MLDVTRRKWFHSSTATTPFRLLDQADAMKIRSKSHTPLRKKARKGFRGFPVPTVALFGPGDLPATKHPLVGPSARRGRNLCVVIRSHEGADRELLKCYSEDSDIRSIPNTESEIEAF